MPSLPDARLLIGGRWCEGASHRQALDKFRLEPCTTIHLPSREQVREAVAAADAAYRASRLTPHERGAILDRAATLLESRADDLVRALQVEVGFPAGDGAGELKRAVQTFRLSAEEARNFCGEMVPIEGAPNQSGRLGFTLRVPLGVVAAITPFNAPLNTVAHKVAPALAAGNAVVLKPSSYTPTAAVVMAECLLAAGLPAGLMTVLHGGADTAQALLDEPRVRFFAFTGSTEVGAQIQRKAGLRRTQMELGSIAYTIVADDADLDRALPRIVNAAYRKAGQVCTSIQMLLVQRGVYDTVRDRLAAMVRALPCGDPLDAATVVGPVISEGEARRIEAWIDRAVAAGATRLAGGPRVGAVVPATLLTDVDGGMAVGCQEVFGPVMSLVPYDTLDEAIDRVNATPFGLATGFFTNRIGDALAAARRLQVGGVHINETSSSRVDVMPYGGSKDSGFGREGPHHAVREMSEERMVTLLA
ncbi:MAG: aldehyde dehydrogenase family protein [Rubrivivax sp.]|jgi:succinate-semialdehyde dehydrogenase/glutarate-semialdehyde dehydrogenase|nr:aldehyde dehydrogenase family protein [Rubrivivax sp.]